MELVDKLMYVHIHMYERVCVPPHLNAVRQPQIFLPL